MSDQWPDHVNQDTVSSRSRKSLKISLSLLRSHVGVGYVSLEVCGRAMGFPRLKVELDQWIQGFIHLQILALVILYVPFWKLKWKYYNSGKHPYNYRRYLYKLSNVKGEMRALMVSTAAANCFCSSSDVFSSGSFPFWGLSCF